MAHHEDHDRESFNVTLSLCVERADGTEYSHEDLTWKGMPYSGLVAVEGKLIEFQQWLHEIAQAKVVVDRRGRGK